MNMSRTNRNDFLTALRFNTHPRKQVECTRPSGTRPKRKFHFIPSNICFACSSDLPGIRHQEGGTGVLPTSDRRSPKLEHRVRLTKTRSNRLDGFQAVTSRCKIRMLRLEPSQ